jgi:hypothetical protein
MARGVQAASAPGLRRVSIPAIVIDNDDASDSAENLPVAEGLVYLRAPNCWRLGTLTVARDHVDFVTRDFGLRLAIPSADVASARVLDSVAADFEAGVFEVELQRTARATARDVEECLRAPTGEGPSDSDRGSRWARPGPLRVWFKVADMGAAFDWASLVDDASQAAADATAGRMWDWFAVPAAPAAMPPPSAAAQPSKLPDQLPLQLDLVRK